MFRDGVGDGQLRVVKEFEVPQLEECFANFGADYCPKLVVIVVQKRINQRILARTVRFVFFKNYTNFVCLRFMLGYFSVFFLVHFLLFIVSLVDHLERLLSELIRHVSVGH